MDVVYIKQWCKFRTLTSLYSYFYGIAPFITASKDQSISSDLKMNQPHGSLDFQLPSTLYQDLQVKLEVKNNYENDIKLKDLELESLRKKLSLFDGHFTKIHDLMITNLNPVVENFITKLDDSGLDGATASQKLIQNIEKLLAKKEQLIKMLKNIQQMSNVLVEKHTRMLENKMLLVEGLFKVLLKIFEIEKAIPKAMENLESELCKRCIKEDCFIIFL